MITEQLIMNALEKDNYQPFLNHFPYSKTMGLEVVSLGKKLIYKLPARPEHIGNTVLPAIHGGCIGGFMESAASFHIMLTLKHTHYPKIIDISIDYLRSGRDIDTFAECTIVRHGRKIVNVSIMAWQVEYEKSIANARINFLLASDTQEPQSK